MEGGADINFNDKSFTATPDVVIHGAKNRKITFDVITDELLYTLNIYYDPEVPWHGYSDIMNSVYKISGFGQDISKELLSKLKASASEEQVLTIRCTTVLLNKLILKFIRLFL